MADLKADLAGYIIGLCTLMMLCRLFNSLSLVHIDSDSDFPNIISC